MGFEFLKDFFSNTNLHGFTYIVQPSRHKTERIFWISSVFISFILTGILIYKLIIESLNNPTIIYTDKNVVHIKDIAFPAVTLCIGLVFKTDCETVVDYKVIKKKLKKDKNYIKKLSMGQLKSMQVVSLASQDHLLSDYFPDLKIPTDDFMDQLDKFHDLVPLNQSTNFLFKSLWLSKYILKTVQVISDSGSCFTFNMAEIDKLYSPKSNFYNFSIDRIHIHGQLNWQEIFNATRLMKSYPRKADRRNDGLSIQFDSLPFGCNKTNGKVGKLYYPEHSILDPLIEGFYLKIHSPYEVLWKRDRKLNLFRETHVEIAVMPKITKLDDSLLDSPIKERNCYLPAERSLEFFKIYNKVNCEHECLAHLTLKSCGCVQFFVARNYSTKVCGTYDEKCFLNVEDQFRVTKATCQCLDLCEDIKYEVELTSREKQYRKHEIPRETITSARVTTSTDVVFISVKKKSQTIVEFLSFVGGILGLFAGFSVITTAEVFYYIIAAPLMENLKRSSVRVHPFLEKPSRKVPYVNKIWKFVREMLENSSIHSFNQIGADGKSLCERIAWLLLFVTSMLLASFMVRDVYVTYRNSALAINYESSPTKVEDIPFPAFTLVRDLETVIKDYFYDNITTFDDDAYYEAMFQQFDVMVCVRGGMFLFVNPNRRFKSNEDFAEVMNYYTFYQPPWFDSRNASWNGIIDPPFAQVMTSSFKGYTFNLMDYSMLMNDLASDDFYYSYGTDPKYPWKTSSGHLMGFKLEVNLTDVYAVYRSDTCVMRDTIILHSPYELPIELEQISIFKGVTYNILVTPKIFKADESLKTLDLSIRKCYFDGERILNFFKIYTQRNCEMECNSFIFTEKAGCTPYNIIHDRIIDICDYHRFKYWNLHFQNRINYTLFDYMYEKYGVCRCLPQCNYVDYSFEVFEEGSRVFDFYALDHPTFFDMRWKDNEYYALVRYQQLRLVDFLAYVGGILGLFAGISVLSIFELFYFFTLRLATNLVRNIKSMIKLKRNKCL